MREVIEQYFDSDDWRNIWAAVKNTWPEVKGDADKIWRQYDQAIHEGIYDRGDGEPDEVPAGLMFAMLQDQTQFEFERIQSMWDEIYESNAKLEKFSC